MTLAMEGVEIDEDPFKVNGEIQTRPPLLMT
jgi:hypothetical protein